MLNSFVFLFLSLHLFYVCVCVGGGGGGVNHQNMSFIKNCHIHEFIHKHKNSCHYSWNWSALVSTFKKKNCIDTKMS